MVARIKQKFDFVFVQLVVSLLSPILATKRWYGFEILHRAVTSGPAYVCFFMSNPQCTEVDEIFPD